MRFSLNYLFKYLSRLLVAPSLLFTVLLPFCSPVFAVSSDSPVILESWQYARSDLSQQTSPLISFQQTQSKLNWEAVNKPRNLSHKSDKPVLWLRTNLPELTSREPTLFIPPVYMDLTVYLDKEIIYTFSGHSNTRAYFWHLINLQENYSGKTLLLKIESDYTKIGISNDLLVGSRSALIENMIKRDADRVMIGLLLAMVGLLAIGFSPRRKETLAYIAFGANALSAAAWIIFYTHVKELVYPNPGFWFYTWLVSMFFMVPTFILYIEKVFGSGYKNSLTYVRWAYLIIMSINVTIYWIWGESPLVYTFLNIARALFIVTILLTVHQVAQNYRQGQKDAGVFLLGFGAMTVFIFHDVSLALGLISEGRTLAYWGEFVLVIVMAIILGMRFNDMYYRLDIYSKKLESTAKERELMVQDLHDGLGGMATNISLLADVAKRQARNDQVKKTLETISGLSRESVTEIRSFMKSLDNTSADWTSFVADLRQYGANTLEAHEIEFSLNEQLDDKIAPPNSVLHLNILRIYKEAIVNIIKHAQATKVDVNLSVTQQRFILSIHDNGLGLDAINSHENTEYSGGKGLRNINSRAFEMGGEAAIESDNGTTVEIRIPLPIKSPSLGMAQEDRS